MISLAWLNFQVANSPVSPQTASQAEIVFNTIRNGQQAVAAWQMQGAWQTELVLLQQVQTLALNLSTAQSAYLANRVVALQNAIPALQALIPVAAPNNAISNLNVNLPAIAYPGVLEFYEVFNYETPPVGYAANNALAWINDAVANWTVIANAVYAYQTSVNITQAYDETTRITSAFSELSAMQTTLAAVNTSLYGVTAIGFSSDFSADFESLIYVPYMSGYGTPQLSWNQIVALPSLLYSGTSITAAPSSNLNQQCGIIRYALGTAINAIALYLLSLRQPIYSNANLATIQNGDSLLDIAARNLNNFEEWTAIATLNGLTAPWVGLQNSQPGDQLLLPNANGTTATTTNFPSYNVNVLGSDWYFGSLKQPMPPWNGDIPIVSGPSNLQNALTRRIMTTLGDLIYHTNFGSRIPPEVGEIQDAATANLITAYGKSALLSDPRVAQVLSASTTLNEVGSGVDSFTANIVPVGLTGNSGLTVDVVLAPLV